MGKKEEEDRVKNAEKKKEQEAAAAKLLLSVQEDMKAVKADPPAVPGAQAMNQLFRDGAEGGDPMGENKKHKPLTRPDEPEKKLRDDEMRRLIQKVPTDKAKAFAYEIDWEIVHDHNIVEKKLRPWVKKKVTEYLGAEEQGMIEFIMRKVSSQTPPAKILAE